MYQELEMINTRPKPFAFYTANELWTNEHTSRRMLAFHLNENIDVSSRKAEFINHSVEWIDSKFNIGEGIKIADFGCGPGLYTTRLAKRGADVTGIDFSKSSIQYAQQVADKEELSIQYVNQNYLDFETDDRFHLILMIMCDFCALSPSQRKLMLRKYHTYLEPNGSVLLDVYSLISFKNHEAKAIYEQNLLDGFWSPNKYYGFLNTFKYETEKVTLDKYTIVESDRTRTVYNWLQYFDTKDLEKEFGQCGFKIEDFYSDVAGSPFDSKTTEYAVVAKRNKTGEYTEHPVELDFRRSAPQAS